MENGLCINVVISVVIKKDYKETPLVAFYVQKSCADQYKERRRRQ